MKQARCEKGHIYDADINSSCPYCNNEGITIDFKSSSAGDLGRTIPIYNNQGSAEPAVGTTSPVEGNTPVGSSSYIGRTNAANNNNGPDIGKTVAPAGKGGDIGKTVSVFSKKTDMKVEPVVGWLVCIEGNDKGRDYRILAKTNSIGRGENMDVVIKGDDTISSDKHAKLDYDIKNNDFYLIPAENKNTIYINDAPAYSPTKLVAGDIIQFGQSKVMFVPFCNDKFRWPIEK